METLLHDIRYGTRALLKTPAFAATAILSLALGIGANTAIFSITDALMLRSIPVEDPERLVLLGEARAGGIMDDVPSGNVELISWPELRDLRKQNQVFSDVCGMFSIRNTYYGLLPGGSTNEPVKAHLVTGNYFSTLGVKPAAGRLFTDAVDESANNHPEIVLSYTWWKTRFAADRNVVGKSIRIADKLYAIIGVAAPEFFGAMVGESPDAWMPLSMVHTLPPYFDFYDHPLDATLYVIGRLRPGVTAAQAGANVNVLFRQIVRSYMGPAPSARDLEDLSHSRIRLTPAANGLSRLRQQYSLPLQVLSVIVALVLLIACANVANLLLARAAARQREFAIRLAIGSGRLRLARQLLTESLLLAAAGGLAGVVFATWGGELLVALVSAGPQRVALNVDPNLRILAFTTGISFLTALIFGLAPALRATSVDPAPALKAGRSSSGAGGRFSVGRALVAAQAALSLMLLIAAGLFTRSFANLENIDPGFERSTLRMPLVIPAIGLHEDQRLDPFYRSIEERVSRIPGVRSAAFTAFGFNQGSTTNDTYIEGHEPKGRRPDIFNVNVVGPAYFETAGIPIVLGRAFSAHDTAGSQKVAVINQKAAHDIFGDASPIGAHLSIGPPKNGYSIEIIGVAKDAKYQGLREDPQLAVMLPYTQNHQFLGNLLIRIEGNRAGIVAQATQAIHEIAPALPILETATMGEVIDRSLSRQHVLAQLSDFFGALALLLAGIGLYGVLSYSVARRSGEIGIRMALGAQRQRVLAMVLGETARILALGIAIGLPVAIVSSRLVENLLYGLTPVDALTISIAVAVLAIAGAVAGFLPARRASKVQPMVALRYE